MKLVRDTRNLYWRLVQSLTIKWRQVTASSNYSNPRKNGKVLTAVAMTEVSSIRRKVPMIRLTRVSHSCLPSRYSRGNAAGGWSTGPSSWSPSERLVSRPPITSDPSKGEFILWPRSPRERRRSPSSVGPNDQLKALQSAGWMFLPICKTAGQDLSQALCQR